MMVSKTISTTYASQKVVTESRRNKVVRSSANILGSRFTGGVKVTPLCEIFVHHVAHQSTLGDLKNHLHQQGFDVAGMRIDVTSNEAAMYKSFRIISSGNLSKALLDPEIWPVGVWVRDYEKLSLNRPRNRLNSQEGKLNYHNGISVCTFNCKGFNLSKVKHIESLLITSDILLLQEIWCLPDQVGKLNRNFKDHNTYGISGINDNELLVGRPHSGVSFLFKKSISPNITWVEMSSSVCVAFV